MWDTETPWMNQPFDCRIALYDVHSHAQATQHGDWLRYRQNGWVYFPMPISRPYEKGLRMGRFRNFRNKRLTYEVATRYFDYSEAPNHFDDLVTWIGLRDSRWNFQIDGGGSFSQRYVRFSFGCSLVAVEFKLRFGSFDD